MQICHQHMCTAPEPDMRSCECRLQVRAACTAPKGDDLASQATPARLCTKPSGCTWHTHPLKAACLPAPSSALHQLLPQMQMAPIIHTAASPAAPTASTVWGPHQPALAGVDPGLLAILEGRHRPAPCLPGHTHGPCCAKHKIHTKASTQPIQLPACPRAACCATLTALPP
jgi:hypothetical protein